MGQESSEVVNIKVNLDSTVVKVNPLIFGVNTMFFMENKNALADGKIVKYLKELGVTTIRSGAEDADNYLWKTSSIADPNEWPGYQPPNSMPTIDDYVRMCQEIGAAPHITVNLGTFVRQGDVAAGVQNAVDMVRYLNIERNYGVKYFELGNEPYTLGTAMRPSEYANDLIAFSKAMKAVDPSIKIVAVGSPGLAGTGMLEPIANGYDREIQSLPSVQR
jgi:alpha-L-arabinofuranosidase